MEFVYEDERIYSTDDNQRLMAEVTMPKRDDKRTDIDHVYVDESLRGEGLASRLMKMAYDRIKEQDKQIVAKCPYAIDWFKKHPEYQDIVINVKTKTKD